MRRFRRLDRTAVEIDEIGDLPLPPPLPPVTSIESGGEELSIDISYGAWGHR